jgi:hypothetical protein
MALSNDAKVSMDIERSLLLGKEGEHAEAASTRARSGRALAAIAARLFATGFAWQCG